MNFSSQVEAVRHLFLYRTWLINVCLLAGAAVFSAAVFWNAVVSSADDQPAAAPPQSRRLAVPLLNELELWIEERQSAAENPPQFPARVFNNF